MTHLLRLDIMFAGVYNKPGMDARTTLEQSIELFQYAEGLGYDQASHRVRHFERALTGVYPFLGAVARETTRIRLGTSTIPIANESPIRLAEDSATVDLLSNGRLELGVGAGHGGRLLPVAFARAYEQEPTPPEKPRTDHVLRRFVHALEGHEMGPLEHGEHGLEFANPDEALRVHPHVDDLRWRVWYGTGSTTSTIRAGALGLGLQLANFGRTATGAALPGPAGPPQVGDIDTYIEAWERGNATNQVPGRPRRGKIAVSRVVIPYADPEQRQRFETAVGDIPALINHGGLFGPVNQIIDELGRDEAINRARGYNETSLMLIMPFYFGHQNKKDLLSLFAEEVGPQLGWKPAHI